FPAFRFLLLLLAKREDEETKPRTPTLGVLFLPRFRVSHVRDLRLRGENRDGGRRGLCAIHPPPVGKGRALFGARGGVRHCEERSDEAIQGGSSQIPDCFAPLAMTSHLPSGGGEGRNGAAALALFRFAFPRYRLRRRNARRKIGRETECPALPP